MSSGIDSVGEIAAVIVAPAAVAVGGAGWLAWQAGRLLVNVNQKADRNIAEHYKKLEEVAEHRKRAALAAHQQLTKMCEQLIAKVNENRTAAGMQDYAAFRQLLAELNAICEESIPDDTLQLERLNSRGYAQLESIANQHQRLSALQIESRDTDLYRGASLANLMQDLKVAMAAMHIQAMHGQNVQAIDPLVLERARLNEKLANVNARTVAALKCVAQLAEQYGLTESNDKCLRRLFDGIDEQISRLYMPSTPNDVIKRGIEEIEETLERYNLLMPTIKNSQKKFARFYQAYKEGAAALDEPILGMDQFKNAEEIEEKLNVLQERAKRANYCAGIYQQLGKEAYISYAWDQELQALGYKVHSQETFQAMANNSELQYAQLGKDKIPFYSWNENELTQLYSMTEKCSLQVIVHDDGSVTMQTLAETNDNEARETQATHCERLRQVHDNLRKNWFILYDDQETASSDQFMTAEEWFVDGEARRADERRRRNENRTMQQAR